MHLIKNTPTARCLAAGLALSLLSLGASQSQAADTAAAHSSGGAQGAMQHGSDMKTGMSQGSNEMNEAMSGGMQSMQQMKMSGDVDKDFAMMMKMHHEQALTMAKVEIDHGKSSELKAMAKKIVKDQTREIAQLDQWIKMHP